jgi:hypothetical protein
MLLRSGKITSAFNHHLNKPWFVYSVLALFTLVFTFPALYPVATRGLDASYVLAFNHLFANDFRAFSDLVYIFGPLGILKYPLPLGYNLELALAWLIIIRLLFIGMIFYLGHMLGKQGVFTFILALVFSSILHFDHIIYGIILMSFFAHKLTGRTFFLATGILLSLLGLFIKINIGFIGLLISASYLGYDLFVHRNYRKTLVMIGLSLVSFIVIYTILLGNPLRMFPYYANLYLLVKGNSSALSIHPENNWILMAGVFLGFLLIPLVDRNKDLYFILIVIALAVFAVFKYSFARQENVHAKHFLDFLFLFALMVLLFPRKLKLVTVLIVFMQISLYYLNLHHTGTYTMDDKVQLTGIVNFKRTVLDFSKFKSDNLKYSKKALRQSQLSVFFLDEIGRASSDYYPFELSYFYANELNYTPRPTLQSGCLFIPPRIDQINAAHMLSEDAPEYMIWERTGRNGLPGIDGRYLLNSDGDYLNAFLGRYTQVLKDRKRALWKRTDRSRLGTGRLLLEEETAYDQWMDVPAADHSILKIKPGVSQTILGTIKNAVYKEGEFFIHYRLADGKEIKHKFSRDNAQTGLWVQPYIRDMNNEFLGDTVLQVKITHTHKDIFLKDSNIWYWYSYPIIR